jgi:YD repeat-containing protein
VGTSTVTFRGPDGVSHTTSTATTFRSVADFVDEVRVVPPLTKSLAATSTTARGRAPSTGSETHAYDAQGRLVRSVGRSATGATSTTTFTAWDAAGRPTLARDAGAGFDNIRRISYDDAARTRTTVVGNGLVTTVETFDANGNPTSQTAAGGPSRSTTVIAIASTQRVCK